ncbi:hypothetical protein [Gracilinema caldarium]|uniref:Uncharacterized protein n=1 Tax=Gracilinema caldarium (strain ATCC 51460 / DSM 7334 / H1) TaxID=744872 RepID=F8EX88_GRAC1|nr:hypothetical protein [Gracilinema caldarium]AEJ18831.1 hypothetical protein Spica_0677 [Gracilinema caldarium DSM 7334]
MKISKTQDFLGSISERFTDVWQLLSETTQFLSKTKEFAHYENQLREWRAQLQSKRLDSETHLRIRSELVNLRKHLRLMGYDLSLAKQILRFEGFRNDACIREGFRRLVVVFTDKDVYWLSGDDNHINLAEYLERRLESALSSGEIERIHDRHYLWYKRQGNNLILSGSDTESKEDFARLEAIGNANPLLLLSKLKGLK